MQNLFNIDENRDQIGESGSSSQSEVSIFDCFFKKESCKVKTEDFNLKDESTLSSNV